MSATNTSDFNPDCRVCPRLTTFLDQTRQKYPDYHCAAVAAFGDPGAQLLTVGLAPGMHGANATGRPFTGDYAGMLLYQTLYDFGYSNRPESTASDDGLELYNCRVTNAVNCLPPQNKPRPDEIRRRNAYLRNELARLRAGSVIMGLGKIAHEAVLRATGMRPALYKFGHARTHRLRDAKLLIDSYHCSRYNTQTRRLSVEMFTAILQSASEPINSRFVL